MLLVETLRALGVRFSGHDPTVLPLTRAAFWERLERADTVTAEADGSLLYRGLLPHVTWTGRTASEAAATTGWRLRSGRSTIAAA